MDRIEHADKANQPEFIELEPVDTDRIIDPYKWLSREIKGGNIPKSYAHELCIVEAETAFELESESQLDEYCNKIIANLSGTQWAQENLIKGRPIPKFQVKLVDRNTVNGAILPSTNPPLILINKGLINLALEKGESALAAVLAHEFWHYITRNYIKASRNSKLEEGIGYMLPPLMLFYAGYDYKALEYIFEFNTRKNTFSRLIDMLDIHPSPNLSQRIVEDAYVAINRISKQTGKQKDLDIPKFKDSDTPNLLQSIMSLKVNDPVQEIITLFEQRFYSETEDMIALSEEIVEWIIQEIPKWLKEDLDPYEIHRRRESIDSLIELISSRGFLGNQLKDRLLDFLFTTPFPVLPYKLIETLTQNVRPLNSRYLSHDKKDAYISPLIQQLKSVTQRMISFEDEPSLESKIEIAKEFWRILSQIPLNKIYTLSNTYLGIFTDFPMSKSDMDFYLFGDLHDGAVETYQMYKDGIPVQNVKTKRMLFSQLIAMATQELDIYNSMYLLQALQALGIFHPQYIFHRIPQVEIIKRELKYYKISPVGFFMDQNGNLITDSKTIEQFFSGRPPKGLGVGKDMSVLVVSDKTELAKLMENPPYDAVVVTNEAEVSQYVGREILSQRQTIVDHDDYVDYLLETNYEVVSNLISNVSSPADLVYLFENYPLYFALRPRLLGGAFSPVDNNASFRACRQLVSKLKDLLISAPEIWEGVIFNRILSQEENFVESIFRPTQLLSSKYILFLMQGKHQHIDYRVNYYNLNKGKYVDQIDYTIDLISQFEQAVPLQHPYFELLNLYLDRFPLSQVIGVLDKSFFIRERDLNGEWLAEPEILPIAKELYYRIINSDGPPQTEEELKRRMLLAKNLDNLSYTRSRRGDKFKSDFLTIIVREESLRFIENLSPTQHLSSETLELLIQISNIFTTLTREAITHNYEDSHGISDELGPFGEDLSNEIDEHVNQIWLDIENITQNNPEEFAKIYVFFEQRGYFRKFPKYRFGEGEHQGLDYLLLNLVDRLEDPSSRRKVCEIVFFNIGVESVRVRDKLIDVWVETVYLQINEDPFSAFEEPTETLEENKAIFLRNLASLVDLLQENIGDKPAIVDSIVERISQKLLLQYHSVKFLKDSLGGVKQQSGLNSAQGKGLFFEGGHEFLTSDEETRLLSIGLLTGSLTNEEIQQFIDHLELRRDSEVSKSIWKNESMSAFFGNIFKDPVNAAYAFSTKDVNFKSHQTRNQIEGQIRLAYENFWARTFEERTYLISLLAFPHNKSIQSEEEISPLINFVLDKVLPYDAGLEMESEINQEIDLARDFILAYAKVTPINEQRILFSALMVSAHTLGETSSISNEYIGKALATVLSNLGPAGVKLAQAIHSYPETPESIRSGMSNVKGNINMPQRINVFERLIQIMGKEEASKKFAHVGKPLGSGSYQYTLQVRLVGRADKLALTILRNNANIYSKNEFAHIRQAMKNFLEIRRLKGKVVDTTTVDSINQLVTAANNNVEVETDYEINYRQLLSMMDIYEGNCIGINGIKVFTRVVNPIDYYQNKVVSDNGEDNLAYKVDTIAPGNSLNSHRFSELSTNIKDAVALAMELIEYMVIFSGGQFEHDRQGENMHAIYLEEDAQFDGVNYPAGSVVVTHFDPGAMYTKDISDKDIDVLSEILISIFEEYLLKSEIDLPAIFLAALKRISSDKDSDYASSLFRAFLARSDIRRYISSEDYILSIIGVLYQTNIISSKLMQILFSKLSSKPQILSFILSQGQLLTSNTSLNILVENLASNLEAARN